MEVRVGDGVSVLGGTGNTPILGPAAHLAVGSMIGGVLASASVRRAHERELPRLARIDGLYREVPVESHLAEALRRHLSALDFIDSEDIRFIVWDDADADPPKEGNVLYLNAFWAVPMFFDGFRAYLHAQVWPEGVSRRKKPLYEQVLIYELQTPPGTRLIRRHMDHWASKDDEFFRGHILAAVDSLAEMLAYDLPKTVRLGMRKGPKQYPVNCPWIANFGVVDQHRDNRAWLRLRNGVLVDTDTDTSE